VLVLRARQGGSEHGEGGLCRVVLDDCRKAMRVRRGRKAREASENEARRMRQEARGRRETYGARTWQ
jgi:hypothetical protein